MLHVGKLDWWRYIGASGRDEGNRLGEVSGCSRLTSFSGSCNFSLSWACSGNMLEGTPSCCTQHNK